MTGWGLTAVSDVASLKMRALRFEDVPDVLRLVRRAVEHGCRRHYNPAQRDAVCASYESNLFIDALGPFETVVAEHDGCVVGVAQLDAPDSRLRALFVDAVSQRAGVGLTLLAEIERRASGRGVVQLHGAMSLNAVPFYLRAGFHPCAGPEQLVSANVSIPVLRMEKRIGTATPP